MPAGIDRFEAGGFEEELARTIDDVEREREEELRTAAGRAARARIIRDIKEEILRRFGANHPDVKVRFLSGPYCDSDVPRGQRGRTR
jgi:hypothetical protein